ncbi:triacylglycerol lipase [[Emmonsia] crescens]|uniref:Carboxylic ester hydrolase n=1 Tax=[Emmonsia] crescens TaxID=73230 RepID=A0A0G2JAM9_9EURO|nr:triacylglycerol lipase [Emmonsia crescens UAMH 3008]
MSLIKRAIQLASVPVIFLIALFALRPSLANTYVDVEDWRYYWPSISQLQFILPSWARVAVVLGSTEAPAVTIRQGTVIGRVLRGDLPKPVEAFLGIPYALPPTNERRFSPPVPVSASNGSIDATNYGKRCSSPPLLLYGWSEDCLNLNIFRPQLQNRTNKLPVAVYFHGGAFNAGSGGGHNSASMMAWSEKPFIAVNFNYRLGAFGFLSSEVAAREGVLNGGLRDQILLLKWVQENIEAFGGDPNDIALFGLSAGAHSIGHHVMHYDAGVPPLFHRAIMESGAATSRAVYPYYHNLHELQFEEFLVEAGCSSLEESEIMPCLRSKSALTIAWASSKIFSRYEPSDRWAFQPVIDGDVIKQAPIRAWESGNWNKVPILTGFNTNEGTSFVPSGMSKPEEFINFFRALIPAMPDADLTELDKLYPDPLKYPSSSYVENRNIRVGGQFKRAAAAYGHFAYICPVRQTAHRASAGQQAPVFLYHWALNKTVKGGSSHGDQVEYETYNPGVRQISAAQDEIAGTLHAYFTSFLTTGDPNAVPGRFPDRPKWKAFGGGWWKKNRTLMLFGEGNDERAGGSGVGVPAQVVDDDWSQGECEFWSDRSILTES